MDNKQIGHELRRIRVKHKYTPEKFGELVLGAKRIEVLGWESDQIRPTEEQLRKVTEIANLSLEKFFDNANSQPTVNVSMHPIAEDENCDCFIGHALFRCVDGFWVEFEARLSKVPLDNLNAYTCKLFCNHTTCSQLGEFLLSLSTEQTVTVMDDFIKAVREYVANKGFELFGVDFEWLPYLRYAKNVCEGTVHIHSVVPQITNCMLFADDPYLADAKKDRAYFHPRLRTSYTIIKSDIDCDELEVEYSLCGEAIIDDIMTIHFDALTYHDDFDNRVYISMGVTDPVENVNLALRFSDMEILQIGETLCREVCRNFPIKDFGVNIACFSFRYNKNDIKYLDTQIVLTQ